MGDAWTTPTAPPAPPAGLRIEKYEITAVGAGQRMTLDVGGTPASNVYYPASLTPTVGHWAWCILQGAHLWPFAID